MVTVRNMIFSDIDKLVNEFALQGWLEKSTEQFTKYLNEQENNKRQVFCPMIKKVHLQIRIYLLFVISMF